MDPIADMITSIRNAGMARLKEVRIPYSRMKYEIARVLLEEGYINNFRIEGEHKKQVLIQLKYQDDGRSVIYGLRRVSKPSRRVYVPAGGIPKVMGGLGINVVSTSKGIMTDKEARREGLGGELLVSVW
ncbi:MAG: 30S ribosomal protein S8 [candidate division WOR-3 bacterium]